MYRRVREWCTSGLPPEGESQLIKYREANDAPPFAFPGDFTSKFQSYSFIRFIKNCVCDDSPLWSAVPVLPLSNPCSRSTSIPPLPRAFLYKTRHIYGRTYSVCLARSPRKTLAHPMMKSALVADGTCNHHIYT